MNIILEYLYRDAANYKNWQDVIFSNQKQLDIPDIEEKIKIQLIDELYFIAEQLELPTAYFDDHNPALDHNWHEYSGLKATTEPVTDCLNRDISDFLQQIESKDDSSI